MFSCPEHREKRTLRKNWQGEEKGVESSSMAAARGRTSGEQGRYTREGGWRPGRKRDISIVQRPNDASRAQGVTSPGGLYPFLGLESGHGYHTRGRSQ